MTKLVDHIFENITKIAESNFQSNENTLEGGFQSALNDISEFMQKMGINNKIIDEVSSTLSNKFYNLLENGSSTENAFKETFESASNILTLSISNDSQIKEFGNHSKEYDLIFANSFSSDKLILIDEAISRGMSAEEAIKFVNNKINMTEGELHGPSNFVKNEKIDFDDKRIVKSEDERILDKMEAEMDEQANKTDREKIEVKDDINIDNFSDNSESDEMG